MTYSRLTSENRSVIESLLNESSSFRKIASTLNVAPSTVKREVFAHRTLVNSFAFGGGRNRCVHRKNCSEQFLCKFPKMKCSSKHCARCKWNNCNTICQKYSEDSCSLLKKPPYVCNPCKKKSNCSLKKYYYQSGKAHDDAITLRSQSRSGMCFTEQELIEIDSILSPKIKNGQSIHHIFATHQEELNICEKTAYTLLHANKISARSIDTPRIVRFRPRKKSKEVKVDKACRFSRSYKDYLDYMSSHPDTAVLQGDSVEGIKGGKCLLTLTWASCDFQIGILRNHNDSASVTNIFNAFYELLGYELFHKVFPDVFLCDNGSEFSNPLEIEKLGLRVFYCDPGRPDQKGACENTHEHIRKILPKGTSFDDLYQPMFDVIFSHINSIIRKKLNDHSAYDVFSSLVGKVIDIQDIFHIQYIHPDDVVLKPSLLLSLKKEDF